MLYLYGVCCHSSIYAWFLRKLTISCANLQLQPHWQYPIPRIWNDTVDPADWRPRPKYSVNVTQFVSLGISTHSPTRKCRQWASVSWSCRGYWQSLLPNPHKVGCVASSGGLLAPGGRQAGISIRSGPRHRAGARRYYNEHPRYHRKTVSKQRSREGDAIVARWTFLIVLWKCFEMWQPPNVIIIR